MYVVIVYDIGQKRLSKMLKLCRKYVNWIQNSVFEGELTEVQLKKFKAEAKEIMNYEKDSLIIFSSREEKWLDKEVVGYEKSKLDLFL